MQGPVDFDETEQDIEKNMAPTQSEKRLDRRSMRRNVRTRAESGTCNVCFAPCSSCMHLKLACMGSKGDEFSDESGRETATSQYSINDGDVLPSFKNKACDSLQHTTSEASNLLSVNSSHDSLSENVESRANIRSSDLADASVESEMLPKLSSVRTVAEDQLSPKSQSVSDQKIFLNKHEDSKAEEGHDDNISCVSRANDMSIAASYYNKNLDRRNLSCTSALVGSLGPDRSGKALFSHDSDLLNEADAGSGSPKVWSKCLSSDANGQLLEDPSLHERTMEHLNLSLSKEAASNIVHDDNLAAHNSADNFPNGKSALTGDASKVASKIYPKLESKTDKDSGDQMDKGFKCSDLVEQDEKLNELVELRDVQEPPLQSVSGDESDESEIVEHDVKVCDICGDAGREDLLAICSRCTDGAEHTYCMREMLLALPEGDWLCEECKLAEETENQKQGLDAEEKNMNKASTQSSSKRPEETIEVTSASKKQAIETSLGSPKSSSPSKIAALSRDSSFKSLDRGKVKPPSQTSFGNHSGIDIPEIARSFSTGQRLQTSKGTLLKSNSFSTLNSKPKVKLVDEVPQKLKGIRESSSLDMKEGPARMMSKSMSFKSGRSSATESKVKMLSPKFSHIQDVKGVKQVKDRNTFERKNLSKLDRPLGSSVTTSSNASMLKVDQKLTPRGENVTVSSTNNGRELKSAQSDGKMGTLSRTTSTIARKGAETSVRASSINGMSSASFEQKFNQVNPKDEPSSSSLNAEKPSNNANDNLQDVLPRSRESLNQGEKTRESSVSRLKPTGTAVSKNVTCQKCKEIGHAAENCTIVSPRASGIDASLARSVREETSKRSKLKAAIEAAMLKKPGIYRKKKESESDGLSSSNVDANCEIASQDQFSVLNKMNEGTHEVQANRGTCSSNFNKPTNIDNVGQLNVHSTDTVYPFKTGDSDSISPSVGKPSHASTTSSVLMMMPSIPEHEYIWQGAFEVCRVGKFLDLYGGLQAHLSTCASPRVLDVVSKFPRKITLHEVPRLSIWPRQFCNGGAKEDNIALYFFAKDLESYEKTYKGLLDNMLKKDLGLKGSFDGVELFIFPSTQLPGNSQRWNTLFFLWGVFKGRRSNCSDSLKESIIPSLNVVPLDKETPTAVISPSENLGLPECIDKETSACESSCDAATASIAPDKLYISLNEDPENEAFSLQTNSEKQDGRLDSKILSKMATDSALLCPKIKCTSPLEEVGRPECRLDAELEPAARATEANSGSNVREETKIHGDASRFVEDTSSFKIFHVGNQDSDVRGSVSEERIVNTIYNDRDEVKVKRDLNEDNMNMETEASLERGLRKRPYLDISETAPRISSSTRQRMPWNKIDNTLLGGKSVSKKLKTDFGGLYGGSGSSDSFASQTCDLGSSSSVEEKSFDKASEEKVILEDLGTTERYFFPVDSHHVKDFQLGANSMPFSGYSSNDDDRFDDGFPNLDLALGAETKSPNKGILPFFVGVAEKNNDQNKPPDNITDKEEEEDGVSASLSLSLSFPFPDKEQTVKPVSKTEQLLPERHHVNTSLLLFGGFKDE